MHHISVETLRKAVLNVNLSLCYATGKNGGHIESIQSDMAPVQEGRFYPPFKGHCIHTATQSTRRN